MAAGHHVGFWYLQYIAETIGYRILKKHIQFDDSSYYKVIGNLRIEDGGHPPCWIFIFGVHSLGYGKYNSEDTASKLVILATI